MRPDLGVGVDVDRDDRIDVDRHAKLRAPVLDHGAPVVAQRPRSRRRRLRVARSGSSASRPGREAPRSAPRAGGSAPGSSLPAASSTARPVKAIVQRPCTIRPGSPTERANVVVEVDREVVARRLRVPHRLVVGDRVRRSRRAARRRPRAEWSGARSPRPSSAVDAPEELRHVLLVDERRRPRRASPSGSRATSRSVAAAAPRAWRARRASCPPRSAGGGPCPARSGRRAAGPRRRRPRATRARSCPTPARSRTPAARPGRRARRARCRPSPRRRR